MRAVLIDDPVEAGRLAEAANAPVTQHAFIEAGTFLAPLLAWTQERANPGSALDTMAAGLARTMVLPTMGHRTGLWAMLADVYVRAGRRDDALAAIRTAQNEVAVTGEHLFLPLLGRLRDAALRSA